jgi:hypothetical protein
MKPDRVNTILLNTIFNLNDTIMKLRSEPLPKGQDYEDINFRDIVACAIRECEQLRDSLHKRSY